MNDESLLRLLRDVASGAVAAEQAARRLRFPFETVGGEDGPPFARLDHHRELRRGFPEVVLAEGKTPDQVVSITRALAGTAGQALVTRVAPEVSARLAAEIPGAVEHRDARAVVVTSTPPKPLGARIGVVSAGTSDIGVAEEAALTAELMGADVQRTFDVGVAGIQRLLAETPSFAAMHALVVVAGMEAALAPVVAGLVPCPIIAVPTSTGYGASWGGLTALLALLNSCSPGVTVVNIDNGFGAGYAAALAVAQMRRLESGADPAVGRAANHPAAAGSRYSAARSAGGSDQSGRVPGGEVQSGK